MRHGKRFNHLGRQPAHRKATLSNMASSLILHKRISTTVAKAKALRKYVEPMITRSKDDTTHSRRMVFKYLQNKESVKELFGDIADKVASRPGGYTRIIRIGNRLGDNAEMCIVELVDYNELLLEETQTKAKTRRGRRKKSEGSEVQVSDAVIEEAVVEETVEKVEEETTPTDEVVEAATEEATEPAAVEEVVEESEEPVAEAVEETPAEPEAEVAEPEVEVVEAEVEVAEPADEAVEEVEAKVEETTEESGEDTTSEENEGDEPEKEKE